MGYSLLQISEILLKADKTTYRLGTVAYENMFSEDSEDVDFERDIIYIYKKAVEYADDFHVGTTKLDQVVERLANRLVIYNYGQLNPIYSDSVISNPVLPTGSVLNDLNDVTITNVQDNQILRYSASLGQWVNVGPNASIRSSQAFTATLNQTVFVTTSPFNPTLLDVYLNGVRLNTSSYSTFGSHTITLYDGCLADDILDVTIYDPEADILDISGYVRNTRTLTINGVTQDLSADRTWNVDTLYNANGTLTGNRVVTVNDKQLVFRSNQSTLQNYTYTVGTPTGIAPSTWPSSVVFEGEYLMNTNNPEPYNTRVWARNQSGSNRSMWVNQVYADITAESTGATNLYNQYYITRRGSQLDTGLVSLIAGLSTITGHGYGTSQSTTTDITTTAVYGYQSFLQNYGGNITNAYSILARTQVSNSYAINNSRNSTITNLYNLYIDNNIGGNFATATVTNLYAVYIATVLGPSGTISNRWGIYAPDAVMDHYFNGNVLLGTTSDTGLYKLDVVGAANFSSDIKVNGLTVGKGASSVFANTALGENVLRSVTSGNFNTAVGRSNSYNITTGQYNTSFGNSTLFANISSDGNTAIGMQSLTSTTGQYNTALGNRSGANITTGQYNTILGAYGFGAGGITTGSFNTVVGSQISGLTSSLSNNIILADGQGNIRIRAFDTGNVVLGGATDTTLAKLQVTGAIQQTSVLSSLLKVDGSGVLVAATLGTDYSVLPPQSGNTGKFLTTDGSILSWADVATANIYTANGTLTSDRTVNSGGFSLTLNPDLYLSGTKRGVSTRTYYTPIRFSTGTWDTFTLNAGEFYENFMVTDASTSISNTGVFINNAIIKDGTYNNNFGQTGLNSSITFAVTHPTNSSVAATGIIAGVTRGWYNDISTNSNTTMTGASFFLQNNGFTNANIATSSAITVRAFQQIISGTIVNDYGYFDQKLIGRSSTSRGVTVTNAYGLYSEVDVGWSSGLGGIITNYYAIYINAIVRATGTISNRWGIYAPDALSAHYFSGNVLLGTTSDTGLYKLDVNGAARVSGETTIDNNLYITGAGSVRTIFVTAYTAGLRLTASSSIGNFDLFKGSGYAQISSINESIRYSSPSHLFGGTTYVSSALVNIESTTQGFLPPRMITTDKTSIVSPLAGLIVYDNTLNALNVYNGTSWISLGAGGGGGGGVPYTGATANVDLGEYELKAGQLTLDITPTGTASVGTTRWNDAIGSSETTLKGGNVILKNGVDLVTRVVNKVTPNATLTKAAYQAVRVSGAQGQRLAVAYAQADSDPNSADTLGLVCETIATNQEGFIITVGLLEGINTTGSLQGETWVDGDVLYLSPTTAGAITKVKPTGNGHIVVIGYVEYAHAINGKIYVKVMNGWELEELHDVDIITPSNNDALIYESSTSLWKNKSIAYVVASASTTYSETATFGTKIIKANTTSGAFTITLPTAVGNKAMIIIKKTAGTPALTIDGSGTETIDDGLTATINKVYESITLISDNANWQIV